MTWKYKLYDIRLNEYYYYENIEFLCIFFMDSVCSPNWRSGKVHFKYVAHSINDYYLLKKYSYTFCNEDFSYTNRFIVFDEFDRIIHKNIIYDKMISMSKSEIRRTRGEYRKNKKSIEKSYTAYKRWEFKQSLRIRSLHYRYYRPIRTTQERRQSCTEYSFLIRDSRKVKTLSNYYDDVRLSRNGFGWKHETKFKKQWMKNLWK